MSNKSKHTPAPWTTGHYSESAAGSWTVWPETPGLSRVCTITDGSHAEANANLIAAAPDLLEALREMCEGWKPQKPQSKYWNTYNKAQAAIAKATA